ncbi:hypothetical protein TH59_07000 [Pantoea ananatis]|uniref:hypothetical protein n=1 Tax=Pantoea ananas TaxID=553 RepID=UPI002350D8D9|nr:hypothetical protein [Pantoea ananatis]MDC7864956.1 hypothetical protein [Pantoea ananatis]
MNTNAQMPSGIDFFDFPDDDALKETIFLIYSSYFWAVARERYEGMESRHTLYRLQWLGDWIAVTNGWKEMNPGITPLKALHSYLIIRYNFSAAEAASMAAEEMNLALEAEWKIYKASSGARDFLRRAEKRLDSLDDPFTGRH